MSIENFTPSNQDIYHRLGRIENSLVNICHKLDAVTRLAEDKENRIRKLERDRNRFIGILAAITGTTGWVGWDKLSNFLHF